MKLEQSFGYSSEESMPTLESLERERTRITEMAILNMEQRGLDITKAIDNAMRLGGHVPSVDTALRDMVSDAVIEHKKANKANADKAVKMSRADRLHIEELRRAGERDL